MNPTGSTATHTGETPHPPPDALAEVRDMVRACIQCGTCTASCPNAFAMDRTPRAMWRMVLAGETTALFSSKTFMLCSDCYTCTLRCPRGLPLTAAMDALKQIAAREGWVQHKKSVLFYRQFMENIRRNGRIDEMGFMTGYFLALKNPVTPLGFAPLGMKLMAKRKIALKPHAHRGHPLEALFRKANEMEARS